MANSVYESVIRGEVAGYVRGWIPLSMAHMVVKINRDVVKIPVDQRQVQFIQKEYPIGNMVDLEFNGCWHIRSRIMPEENGLSRFLYDTY